MVLLPGLGALLARAIAVANELKRAGYTEKILSVGFGKSRSSALKGLPESKKKDNVATCGRNDSLNER